MAFSKDELMRSRIHSPMLWILLPLLTGLILAPDLLPHIPWKHCLYFGFSLMAIWLSFRLIFSLNNASLRILGVLAVMSFSLGYVGLRNPSVPSIPHFVPHEATFTLEFDQLYDFSNKHNESLGIGHILKGEGRDALFAGSKVYFQLKNPAIPVIRSSQFQARGVLEPNSKSTPFGEFLSGQGVQLRFVKGSLLALEKPPSPFYNFCDTQNRKFLATLTQGVADSPFAGVYTGMLLGSKGQIDPDLKEAFKRTGSLHLFAISGLHVGVIGAFIALLLSRLPLHPLWTAALGLILLFLYVQITGGAPSAMRAFLMVAFYWMGRVIGRKKCAFSSLLGSAVAVLLWDPSQLWNVGFQLSYSVVAALLLYGLPMNEWAFAKFHSYLELRGLQDHLWPKLVRWAIGLLNVSYAALLASAPLSVLYFHNFAPGGVFSDVSEEQYGLHGI